MFEFNRQSKKKKFSFHVASSQSNLPSGCNHLLWYCVRCSKCSGCPHSINRILKKGILFIFHIKNQRLSISRKISRPNSEPFIVLWNKCISFRKNSLFFDLKSREKIEKEIIAPIYSKSLIKDRQW